MGRYCARSKCYSWQVGWTGLSLSRDWGAGQCASLHAIKINVWLRRKEGEKAIFSWHYSNFESYSWDLAHINPFVNSRMQLEQEWTGFEIYKIGPANICGQSGDYILGRNSLNNFGKEFRTNMNLICKFAKLQWPCFQQIAAVESGWVPGVRLIFPTPDISAATRYIWCHQIHLVCGWTTAPLLVTSNNATWCLESCGSELHLHLACFPSFLIFWPAHLQPCFVFDLQLFDIWSF